MNGICASALYGLKRVHVGNTIFEIIPVDLCVKGMIIASERHQKDRHRLNAIPVYNAASVHKFTFKTLRSLIDKVSDHFLENAIGTPYVMMVKNYRLAAIIRFLSQIVPALLIDTILRVKKRPPIVMKYQRILRYSEKAVDHFISNEFKFDTNKYQDLGRNLHKDDEEDFYSLPRNPMMEYFIKSHIVTKEVVLNETAECAARAKKKIPYWKALGWVIKALVAFIAYKILLLFYGIARNHFM